MASAENLTLSVAELAILFGGSPSLLPLPARRLSTAGWDAVIDGLRARGVLVAESDGYGIASSLRPLLGVLRDGSVAILVERMDEFAGSAGFVVEGPVATSVDIVAGRLLSLHATSAEAVPGIVASLTQADVGSATATEQEVDAAAYAAALQSVDSAELPEVLASAIASRPRWIRVTVASRDGDGTVSVRRVDVHGDAEPVVVEHVEGARVAQVRTTPDIRSALMAPVLAAMATDVGAR